MNSKFWISKFILIFLGSIAVIGYQNCSNVGFGGNNSEAVFANGDGHEGKLSIPVDYVQVRPDEDIFDQVDFTSGINFTNSTDLGVEFYCRSKNESLSEGVDIIITKPYNQWQNHSESYNFVSGIPANSSFSRNSIATYWDESVMRVAPINAPRFRMIDGQRALTIEPGRTNELFFSNVFTNAVWEAQGAQVALDMGQQNPFGVTGAYNFAETNGFFGEHRLEQSQTLEPNEEYTFSILVKNLVEDRNISLFLSTLNDEVNFCHFKIREKTSESDGLSAITCHREEKPNGWVRLGVSINVGPEISDRIAKFGLVIKDASQGEYLGVDNDGFIISAAQLEKYAFMTSYIDTEGTSATREADLFFLREGLAALNQFRGTMNYQLSETSALSVEFTGSPSSNSLKLYSGSYDVQLDNAVTNHSFSQPISQLSFQRNSTKFTSYAEGRFLSDLNSTDLFLGELVVSGFFGTSYLVSMDFDADLGLKQLLGLQSDQDKNESSSYAIISLKRDDEQSEYVQSQSVEISQLDSDFGSDEYFFSLNQSSNGEYVLNTGLSDGTIIYENMICEKP